MTTDDFMTDYTRTTYLHAQVMVEYNHNMAGVIRMDTNENIENYTRTMYIHTQMMADYNRNMSNIIRMNAASPPPPSSTRRSTPTRRDTNTTRRNNRVDAETLVLFLNQLNPEYGTLTDEQIERATEEIEYEEAENSETRCPIALDEFEPGELICRIRHCGHIFKCESIARWFTTHTCCPVCRHDLLETEENRASDSWARIFDISGSYTIEFPRPFT
jgi:hypothetical protein